MTITPRKWVPIAPITPLFERAIDFYNTHHSKNVAKKQNSLEIFWKLGCVIYPYNTHHTLILARLRPPITPITRKILKKRAKTAYNTYKIYWICYFNSNFYFKTISQNVFSGPKSFWCCSFRDLKAGFKFPRNDNGLGRRRMQYWWVDTTLKLKCL